MEIVVLLKILNCPKISWDTSNICELFEIPEKASHFVRCGPGSFRPKLFQDMGNSDFLAFKMDHVVDCHRPRQCTMPHKLTWPRLEQRECEKNVDKICG